MTSKRVEKYKLLETIIKQRGGILLSEEYINSATKIKVKCYFGHEFWISPQCIKRGQWCARCRPNSRSEEICRIYFETMLGHEFTKCRPKWLHGLELDGYCPELGIAFEHNGRQHYEKVKFIKTDLNNLQRQDKKKQRLCKKNGVVLIVIQQLFKVTKLENLGDIISTELIKNNINLKLNLDEPNISDVYKNTKWFEKFKMIVESRNGKLLEKCFKGTNTPHLVLCNNCGTSWCITYWNLKRGNWCKKCAGKAKKTIQDAKNLAKIRGGICLSDKYINNSSKLKWKCAYGHFWSSSYNCVQSGGWCYKCGRIKTSIKLKQFHKQKKHVKTKDI